MRLILKTSVVAMCAWAILFLTVWALVYTLSDISSAQKICDNLLREELLNDSSQCLISWDTQKFLPAMFPPGVSKIYVEKGMQGFYLESDLGMQKLYLLRQTPPTRLTWFFSKQVVFVFGQTGKLLYIEFEFF